MTLLTDVLAGLKTLILVSRENTEGVSTKVITLSLEEVGRNNFTAVTVEEGKSSAESRSGNTPENGLSDHATPSGLSLCDG